MELIQAGTIDLLDAQNKQLEDVNVQEKPHFDFEEKELSSVQIESQNSFTEMSGSHSSFMSDEDRVVNYNNELVIKDNF